MSQKGLNLTESTPTLRTASLREALIDEQDAWQEVKDNETNGLICMPVLFNFTRMAEWAETSYYAEGLYSKKQPARVSVRDRCWGRYCRN